MKRIEEDAIGTLIGGKACSARRFNGDMCTGVPTKKKIHDFWGDALENLPRAAMEIHIEKGVFYDGKKEITPGQAEYELGIVSYSGGGKYIDSIYLPFHELPDSDEVASKRQVRGWKTPPGQGWWPVICLQTKKELGQTKKLIVCWYQLLADGIVMAWWIVV